MNAHQCDSNKIGLCWKGFFSKTSWYPVDELLMSAVSQLIALAESDSFRGANENDVEEFGDNSLILAYHLKNDDIRKPVPRAVGKENWEVTPQQKVPVFFVSLLPLPWTGRCSRTGWCLSCSPYFLTITNYLNLCNFINKRDWFGSVWEAKNPRLLGLASWMAWWRSERSCHQTQRSGILWDLP